MMDVCFQEVLMSRCVFIYVNDLEELRLWIWKVLTIMRVNHLSCKPIKCQFKQKSVHYLSIIVDHSQTAISPKKAKAIVDWLTLRNLKEVQSFLGMCSF
jgi:hypothetical protein